MHGAASTHLNREYARKNNNTEQERHMLGGSAFKLSISGRINTLPTRLYTTKVICRHPFALFRNEKGTTRLHSSPSNCHSSSCLLAKDGLLGGTIWHSLLPSSCLYVEQQRHFVQDTRVRAYRGLTNRGGLVSSGKLEDQLLIRRFTTAYKDGSWNVAGDARPARWLHARHSAWLLFGFCSCFTTNPQENPPVNPTVACCDAPDVQVESHGKKVFKEFNIIGIPGDGRCLFRAVAHGYCRKQGKQTSNEDSQRELADELRSKVVDELVQRRSESEWFIEGDFDQYTERMREPHVWGGEPELLMLSHVLKMPITVYMSDSSSNGIIAIAEYGQEYGKENPIRVLYHGFGHYDALQMPGDATQSRL